MGYKDERQFKEMVVGRMRREVDASKDWDSLITVRSAPPERSERLPRTKVWSLDSSMFVKEE